MQSDAIILIKGITPDEFIKYARSKLKTIPAHITSMSVFDSAPEQEEHDQIPNQFGGVSTWPKESKLLCAHCSLRITEFPRFILSPESIKYIHEEFEDKSGKIVYKTRARGKPIAFFNTWSCAVSYIDLYFPKNKQDLTYALLLIEEEFTNERKTSIPPAPPKILMKSYGGKLTEQEYLKLIAISMEKHVAFSNIIRSRTKFIG